LITRFMRIAVFKQQ